MDKNAFFKHVRTKLGRLSQSQVDGFEVVLAAIGDLPLAWQSYALATVWHEVGGTMLPIKERGSDAYFFRMYDIKGARPRVAKVLGNTLTGDGVMFAGRGYVQVTGRLNYERLDREAAAAGLIKRGDLMANPDLAKRPDIAALALRKGMLEGWFTGKKLADCLPQNGVATRAQYINARRIINGTDKADLIEDYAQIFERALRNGGLS